MRCGHIFLRNNRASAKVKHSSKDSANNEKADVGHTELVITPGPETSEALDALFHDSKMKRDNRKIVARIQNVVLIKLWKTCLQHGNDIIADSAQPFTVLPAHSAIVSYSGRRPGSVRLLVSLYMQHCVGYTVALHKVSLIAFHSFGCC